MKKQQKKALAVGAGVAALAAAAAGVYMMTGKNAKNRKKVAKWADDLKKDVVKELDKAGKVSKATYEKVVDTAAKNYAGLKTVKAPELAALASELKGHWDNISGELEKASKSVRKVVPKTAKKVAKEVKAVVAKSGAKKAVKKAVKKVTKKAAPRRRR
ncbi:MAG TPA: hypothetical protein VHQ20_01450 [Patescibacteria group bacterium]|jgi:uncharacterized protein YicC (UPF0701 family)|nr:hypothetical protein [Patescibacteria group bacterium]